MNSAGRRGVERSAAKAELSAAKANLGFDEAK
jgi:hypothetical protein